MALSAGSRQQFMQLLKSFETAMFVTHNTKGQLRARPMQVANSDEQGDMWFITSEDSPKIDEIKKDQSVCITMQQPTKYVSLTGYASIDRNRDLIQKLWKPSWQSYFPQGVETPGICLIKVDPCCGDYWDYSGTKMIRYVYETVKATLSHEKVHPEKTGDAGHVELSAGGR